MILWEMHNARNRGAHKRTALKFPVPGPNATWEEKELFLDPYNLAARIIEGMGLMDKSCRTRYSC